MKYDELERDVIDLQESMNIMSQLVNDQQQQLDSIEEEISKSKIKVRNAIEDVQESKQIDDSLQITKYVWYMITVGGIYAIAFLL
jgi:t-SNARE complex subunit (syntaxin)